MQVLYTNSTKKKKKNHPSCVTKCQIMTFFIAQVV